jgi:hypothetical protein
MSNKHRINSIHLSNPFIIDFFFSPTHDIKYSRLESLYILGTIESQYQKNLLIHLASFPKLSSLAISTHHDSDTNRICNLIFQLPVLKSCKISFAKTAYFGLLRLSTNKPSPIEHLIIDGRHDYTSIDIILSYVPQLRRLSINYIEQHYPQRISVLSTVVNNLTHVSLKLERLKFEQFELFIKQYFGHVKVLQISSSDDTTYIDADRWERLILSHMPYLHIFDIQHRYEIKRWDKQGEMYDFLLQKFNSPFLIERQWFFTHDDHTGGLKHGVFNSIRPYR